MILIPLFATDVVDTGGKFDAGVVDTGGNLPPMLLTPAANLPPVSLLPVAICHRCCWHRQQIGHRFVDTGGKFVTGINNTSETGGKICCWCR
jgi:hypothetical protein